MTKTVGLTVLKTSRGQRSEWSAKAEICALRVPVVEEVY